MRNSCQANDELTYLNERQIDLPADVRFLRFSAHSEEFNGRMAVSCPDCVL